MGIFSNKTRLFAISQKRISSTFVVLSKAMIATQINKVGIMAATVGLQPVLYEGEVFICSAIRQI